MTAPNSLEEALSVVANVNATPDSKQIVRLALRNRYGDFVLAGVFGQAVPEYLRRGITRFYADAHGGTYDALVGRSIPRRYGLGDISGIINPEGSKAEDSWALVRLQNALPASHDATMRLQLEQFYRDYVAPHVINPEAWIEAETAMLIVLLYSFEDPMTRIHAWFKNRLAPGIVCSLQRYQLDLFASHDGRDDLSRLSFDPMLVMSLLRAIAKPDGIRSI